MNPPSRLAIKTVHLPLDSAHKIAKQSRTGLCSCSSHSSRPSKTILTREDAEISSPRSFLRCSIEEDRPFRTQESQTCREKSVSHLISCVASFLSMSLQLFLLLI